MKKNQDKVESKMGSIRDGFGQAMLELGQEKKEVVALCGDLSESVRLKEFASKFPKKFVEVGVAEQNMMGVAVGLALSGKIPFAASFAVFNPGRNWDQLRVGACYSNLNVKVVGGHAGLNVGPDGATHQALEDIALTRVLPNMTVVVPCDELQTKLATRAIAEITTPCYLRLTREKSPIITTPKTPFKIGKAQVLRKGSDVTIVAVGLMVAKAIEAAEQLEKNGLQAEVINLHTIKPLDKTTILASLIKTNCLVTVEEHQLAAGMGSAVLESMAEHQVPVQMVGVKDTFGESGLAQDLFNKYGLTSSKIV